MRLLEHEGKALFQEYGIPVPKNTLVRTPEQAPIGIWIAKAQVHSGDRAKAGGIQITDNTNSAHVAEQILSRTITGERVLSVLFEEVINNDAERFVSFLYDPAQRAPVLMLGTKGGSGISDATPFVLDPTTQIPLSFFEHSLMSAGFPENEVSTVAQLLEKAAKLFFEKKALVVEINPLFITSSGSVVAGDSKIELDDAVEHPSERTYVELEGDIALLASGGGASMLALDALIREGGNPANYTEYSGNPSSDVVTELTKRVLAYPKLKGCFVVGAAANFTDIEATLSGFLEGLRSIHPKPTYPIVIRRDGPRREEAFSMLAEAKEKEGFDFHLYDATTPITESAKMMVDLAYKKI